LASVALQTDPDPFAFCCAKPVLVRCGNQLACCLLISGIYSMRAKGETEMHGIIYLIGLVVVILAVLSLFGLR
jgi:hypothetical protein